MSSPASTRASLLTPAVFIGGCFVCVCTAFILYGMSTIQAHTYLRKYLNDPLSRRLAVTMLWAAETLHTAICIFFMYQYLIANFDDVSNLAHVQWSAGAMVVITLFVIVTVHYFFIQRMWVLSGGCLLAMVMPCVLIIAGSVLHIAICIALFRSDTWVGVQESKDIILYIKIAPALLASSDVFITATLIYYLHKSRTGFHSSDRLLLKLEAYILNSGAIMIAAALAVLLSFVFAQDTLLFAGFYLTLCKIYNNALLASLNARRVNENSENPNHGAASPSYELPLRARVTGTASTNLQSIDTMEQGEPNKSIEGLRPKAADIA